MRRIETVILAAIICIALVVWLNGSGSENVMNDRELRIAHMIGDICGTDNVTVILSEDEGSAVIIADSADDMRLYLSIQRAVCTITGYAAADIEIIARRS